MSLVKRGPRYAYDFTFRGVRYTKSGFRTRAIATQAQEVHRARLIDQRLAAEYGIGPPRGRIPLVRHFFEKEYLPEMQATRAKSTVIAVRSSLKPFVAAYSGFRISDVTTRHLEAFRDARLKAVSANSLRRELDWVGHLFRMAIQRGYIQVSPRSGLRLPREERWPDRILTPEEETTLLASIEDARYRDMARLAILTGLRRNEICRLHATQVDVEQGQVRLSQTKTAVIKIVPVSEEARKILGQYSAVGYLFPTRSGHPVHGTDLGRVFRRAVSQAGLERLRFHDLRHTFAVRLLEAGWDIPVVGELLGHKPPYHTTLRYIAHTRQARLRQAISSLHPQQKSRPTEKQSL